MNSAEMINASKILYNKSFTGYYQIPTTWSYRRILTAIAYCILMVTGLTMNTLVIYVIAKRKLLRRSINYFIFNMAFADILLCCFVMAVRFSLLFTYGRWSFKGYPGIVSCKIVNVPSEMALIVSILSLVFMTFDRFLAISYPTKANLRTHKTRTRLLFVSWLIPVLYSSKNLYSYTLLSGFCGEFWGFERHVVITTVIKNFYTVAFIFIPLVLLILMHGSIAFTLKRRQAFSRNSITTDQQRIRQKQRRRINVLALSIVVAFVICNSPLNFYVYVVHSFVAKWTLTKSRSFEHMVTISFVLAFSHATINPIVCIVFNQEIKRSVRKMMPLIIRRPFGGGSYNVDRNASLDLNVCTTITANSVQSRINEAMTL